MTDTPELKECDYCGDPKELPYKHPEYSVGEPDCCSDCYANALFDQIENNLDEAADAFQKGQVVWNEMWHAHIGAKLDEFVDTLKKNKPPKKQ